MTQHTQLPSPPPARLPRPPAIAPYLVLPATTSLPFNTTMMVHKVGSGDVTGSSLRYVFSVPIYSFFKLLTMLFFIDSPELRSNPLRATTTISFQPFTTMTAWRMLFMYVVLHYFWALETY